MTRPADVSDLLEQEMQTVIFYLTAFGYIDGNFDAREREYIRRFIEQMVVLRSTGMVQDTPDAPRIDRSARWSRYFQQVFQHIDQVVQGYFTESVSEGEDTREFVFAKLKVRCYELFRRFTKENQERLLALADELIKSDGVVHPNEAKFRDELSALLAAPPPPPPEPVEASDAGATQAFDYVVTSTVVIDESRVITPRKDNHQFFKSFERPYAWDKQGFAQQIQGDLNLVEKTMARMGQQRVLGAGMLGNAQHVADLAGKPPFLDGFVHVLPPVPDKSYELLVIGDLHGCYSCFKAALMQADFFAKVEAHMNDPVNNPAFKLVLLGDYIDRGRFSYNGILRTAMLLYLAAPEHVYILRGNHEYYIEHGGHVLSGVRPAEALESLMGLASQEVFATYRRFFESMPTTLLFGPTIFVHAGIPRDATTREKWKGLASLNDPEIKFQMLWSDPADVDVIPTELQQSNSRFSFGQRQFKQFMQRLGCTTMIRGHEREIGGFRRVYSDPDATLLTLFSAGGASNNDLPPDSNYREVMPMALTIKYKNGFSQLSPFAIDWERYNKPELNGFFELSV